MNLLNYYIVQNTKECHYRTITLCNTLALVYSVAECCVPVWESLVLLEPAQRHRSEDMKGSKLYYLSYIILFIVY